MTLPTRATRRTWRSMGLYSVLLVVLLVIADSSFALRPPRGGRRGGGGTHRMHSAPSHRGSARPQGRGSVRQHQPSSNRGRGASGSRSVPRRNVNRSSSRSSHRSSSHRSSTGRGDRSPSNIQRTPGHGSLRERDKATRSFAERRREGPDRGPGGRLSDGDPGFDRDPLDRHLRRRALTRSARRYAWLGGWYYWDDGNWWEPYYEGDDTYYVETAPPEGLVVDALPEGTEEVTVGDEVLYEADGVYYRPNADGTYTIVNPPDDGLPDPVTIARRTCEALAGLPAFTLVATDSMDHVQDDGRKIQSHTTRTVHLQRPDRLAATSTGDDADSAIWYDGAEVTLVDRLEGVTARTAAPGAVDEMLDFIVTELGLGLPLIDLLYSDPYAMLSGAMQDSAYIGLIDVNGVSCHHLSFSTDDVDWELWIDSGEPALPTMMAITYATVDESPTYRVEFEQWTVPADFGPEVFEASIPEGVQKIAFKSSHSEIKRLEDAIDSWRDENRRVDEHLAVQRTIDLFSQIAEKPDAAKRIEAEKARLAEIGPVSQDEIDAYLERKNELEAELAKARRSARGS